MMLQMKECTTTRTTTGYSSPRLSTTIAVFNDVLWAQRAKTTKNNYKICKFLRILHGIGSGTYTLYTYRPLSGTAQGPVYKVYVPCACAVSEFANFILSCFGALTYSTVSVTVNNNM